MGVMVDGWMHCVGGGVQRKNQRDLQEMVRGSFPEESILGLSLKGADVTREGKGHSGQGTVHWQSHEV